MTYPEGNGSGPCTATAPMASTCCVPRAPGSRWRCWPPVPQSSEQKDAETCENPIFNRFPTFDLIIFWFLSIYLSLSLALSFPPSLSLYIWARSPDPHTPPQWYPPPLLTPPPPQNLVFACYLHIYIHIYTYILPFPPLQPRISTLFAALESHDHPPHPPKT